MRNRIFTVVGAAAVTLLGASGCITTTDYEQEQAAAQQANFRVIEERNNKALGTIEQLQTELDKQALAIDQLKAQQRQNAAGQQVAALQQQVADLERRLQSAEAARARDREEIVATITANVKRLIESSARPAAAPASSGAKAKPVKMTGREHKVEAGETISAIAAAYGVKASAVLEANNLKATSPIRVGQVLFIPDAK
jgi:LysM repeat protein